MYAIEIVFLPALVVTGNVELHSVDQRLGNFVVVAVLVVEQLLYRFVLVAEPITFGNENKFNTLYQFVN